MRPRQAGGLEQDSEGGTAWMPLGLFFSLLYTFLQCPIIPYGADAHGTGGGCVRANAE